MYILINFCDVKKNHKHFHLGFKKKHDKLNLCFTQKVIILSKNILKIIIAHPPLLPTHTTLINCIFMIYYNMKVMMKVMVMVMGMVIKKCIALLLKVQFWGICWYWCYYLHTLRGLTVRTWISCFLFKTVSIHTPILYLMFNLKQKLKFNCKLKHTVEH